MTLIIRACLLLIVGLLGCLIGYIDGVEAQQNGEVMAPTRARDHQHYERDGSSKLAGDASPDPMKVQYVNVNGQPVLVQFTYVGPPKILPIATADSYPEGATINLMCTISGGQRKGLVLSWKIDGEDLDVQKLRTSDVLENVSIGVDDTDISILKIRNATSNNSGLYSCLARNPLGQDSTTVKIVVNVELKWTKLPKNVEIGLNQELSVECDATGSPPPTIEWYQHPHLSESFLGSNTTKLVSKGKILRILKVQHKDSGLFECIAKNAIGENLRKVIEVKVRGK